MNTLVTIFTFMLIIDIKDMTGYASPIPKPDNDVIFHINMPMTKDKKKMAATGAEGGDDYAIINKGTFSDGFTQDVTGNGNSNFINEGTVKGKVTQKIEDCVRKVKGTRSQAPEDIDNSPE